ncbi:MAG TPA: transposase [Steroidobacteraceae bacterium]|nr:transposase [Steroidobacteraceae bacterium]
MCVHKARRCPTASALHSHYATDAAMPRPLRLHAPGATYHVTMRGNHRQNIFFNPTDRHRLSEIISTVIERFQARVHAYCYMSNHVHLLIQVCDAPLGRLMLRIAGQYARQTQATLHTTGHLFEKRYHPTLVDTDSYLTELLRYIHLNPVRARIVASPDQYPWSSHHAYLGTRQEQWVTTDTGLAMFHLDRNRAIDAYARFIREETGESANSPFDNRNPHDQRILGDDAFAARILGDDWKPPRRVTLEQLIAQACSTFAVTLEELRSSSRSPAFIKARAWIAHQAIAHRTASISAVARTFNRDESTLRHGMQKYFGNG